VTPAADNTVPDNLGPGNPGPGNPGPGNPGPGNQGPGNLGPAGGPGPAADDKKPLLAARDLVQEFVVREAGGARGGVVQAVSGVSFDIMPGETLGIVGETGSGKSTLARAVLQAPHPKSGTVTFRGQELTRLRGRALVSARRDMQFVWQDPFGSLDPKWQVRSIIEEPLAAHSVGNRDSRRKRVEELLDLVGLDPVRYARRHPRELSGGQAQRVAIARAVALEPSLLICDEAVSSLDVLIQAQVLNLFERLRRELGLSYLFIAHDLALVKQVSDRVAVMYLGKFCEVGPGEAVYQQPLHPYPKALLDSIPSTEPGAARATATLRGEPPSPINPPSGCRFRTRCPRAADRCASEVPEPRELAPGHLVACHFPLTEPPPAGAAGTGSASTGPGQSESPAAASTAKAQG
jgi:oligopeptide/dipeptide ABC transporter ATP-binding protein